MRIIGGTASRSALKVPKGFDVRPTPDLVRQAIFNSLGSRPDGARVLELFAGTGALSLECLSRGAKQITCIELSPKHADFIRSNAAKAGLDANRILIRVQDAFTAVQQLAEHGMQFDLILADPPYGEKNVGRRSTSFAQKLLDDKNLPKLLAPGGLFLVGHTKRDTLELMPPWKEKKFMKHGDTAIRFLRIPGAEPEPEPEPPTE